jgi:16S rRNA (uracil1498-N3)-methyltransferase
MKRFFGRFEGNKIVIEEGEFFHLSKVLRMREGEQIIASVNDENNYYCVIEKMGKNSCIAGVERVEKCPALPKREITLFQMLPKKDYFDEILAKSVELGVSRIVPFTSAYTMIKNFKRERVDTQIMTACKQCERSMLVPVEDVVPFEKILPRLAEYDLVIFAYERETIPFDAKILENKQKIAVIVGNEGSFAPEEVEKLQALATSVSLGTRILRCDTAVTTILALVSVLSGN